MAAFGVISPQLALEAADNMSAIADEVSGMRRRYPWVRMVVVPEPAADEPCIYRAEARGAGLEIILLAKGGRAAIPLDIDFERVRRFREPTRKTWARCRKGSVTGRSVLRLRSRARRARIASRLGSLAHA